MKRFFQYLYGTLIKPKKTFQFLLKDKQHLNYGIGAIFLIGTLYTLTVIGLAAAKAKIVAPAWLNIPAQHYYFWEVFFTLPIFILCWLLATLVIVILSKFFKGIGSYGKTLTVTAFALTIPSIFTWLHETIWTLLFVSGIFSQNDLIRLISKPGFWRIFFSAYQFIAIAWYIFLFTIAVSISQKLKIKQSAFIGVLTLAVVGFIMVVFLR